MGSPRKNGNSALLAKEAIAGVKAAGAQVESFYLHGMKIKPCTACDACRRKKQKDCILKDDMAPLYSKLRASGGDRDRDPGLLVHRFRANQAVHGPLVCPGRGGRIPL